MAKDGGGRTTKFLRKRGKEEAKRGTYILHSSGGRMINHTRSRKNSMKKLCELKNEVEGEREKQEQGMMKA